MLPSTLRWASCSVRLRGEGLWLRVAVVRTPRPLLLHPPGWNPSLLPFPLSPARPAPKEDYWTETEDSWLQFRAIPHHAMCYPPDTPVGPDPADLNPIRVAQMVYSDD
jgi:hypothetical protein